MSQCYGDLPPLQKDKTKEFKEPVIYSPMLTQTDMNISVKNKLYDFHFTNNRTGFKDFQLTITPTYQTLHMYRE
jgi:hypothetical protein